MSDSLFILEHVNWWLLVIPLGLILLMGLFTWRLTWSIPLVLSLLLHLLTVQYIHNPPADSSGEPFPEDTIPIDLQTPLPAPEIQEIPPSDEAPPEKLISDPNTPGINVKPYSLTQPIPRHSMPVVIQIPQPELQGLTPPPQDRSQLVDLSSQITELLRQLRGQEGVITFTLVWFTPDDLDLHVTSPSGEKIWYGQRQNAGGALDVDTNAGGIHTKQALENIRWLANSAPVKGTYRAEVMRFTQRSAGPCYFIVRVMVHGEVVSIFSGSVNSAGQLLPVYTLDY